MLSSKKVKLDFESNKKLENLNLIVANLFSNPGLNKTKKFNEAKNFVLELTKCLGIEPNSRQPFSFILNSKFRKNAGWFEDHPVMADSKAGEYIKHDNKCPIDINIFWLNKLVNSRIKGAVHFSANYEDSKLTREESDKHIGIDTFLHPDLRGITIALSDNGNVRVLELRGALNVTQKQILSNWIVLGNNLIENEESKSNRKYIHESLWDSFELKMVNKVFYEMIASAFNELSSFLVDHKIFDEASAKNFSNRLISRILFIWFLRKKEFIFTEKIDYFNVDNLDDKDYYYQKLTKLFFNVLNTPWEDRDKKNDDLKTPYLNGGLFKRNKEDIDKIDFPKGFFCRLYQNLNEYNFTVDESSVDFQQVAIDPEMLGKVFENLLASMADENGEQARKAKGSFYTPREIVTYMCRESLREYLFSKIASESDRKIINELIDTPDHSWEIDKSNSTRDISKKSKSLYVNIMNALRDVKVLDPACGSGAYPISMMYELLRLNLRLDRRLDEYRTKFEIFKNNIYGVDIDPIAIEISRLRSFLSLVVDQEYNDKKINGGIESLPNLEFKFVCANTLVNLSLENVLFDDSLSFVKKLSSIKERYFKADVKQKVILEKEWSDLTTIQKDDGEKNIKLKSYKPFEINNSAEFYFPFLMHDMVDAFDVVIGNPPYIQLQKFKGKPIQNIYKRQNYEVYDSSGDIYCLFYEKGIKLLKNNGILAYITSNKWMRSGYGQKLRYYFSNLNVLQLIDLGANIFEYATVDTNILIIKNIKIKNKKLKAVKLERKDKKINLDGIFLNNNKYIKLGIEPWFIGSEIEHSLKEKIEKMGKPLKDWSIKINYGIKTGLNEAFIINEEKRKELIEKDPKSIEIIKPILRGRDIKKYGYDFKGLYLLQTQFDLDIQKLYPVVYGHLKKFEKQLKIRGDQGKNWWNLRACAYYNEFEKEKIVYSEIVRNPQFYLDYDKFYIEASGFIMTGNNMKYVCGLLNSKLITFIFKHYYAGGGLGEEGYRYKKNFIELLPLPIYNKNLVRALRLEEIVDNILTFKKKNKEADTKNLESQIDQMIYELYGLTEEERKIIENSVK